MLCPQRFNICNNTFDPVRVPRPRPTAACFHGRTAPLVVLKTASVELTHLLLFVVSWDEVSESCSRPPIKVRKKVKLEEEYQGQPASGCEWMSVMESSLEIWRRFQLVGPWPHTWFRLLWCPINLAQPSLQQQWGNLGRWKNLVSWTFYRWQYGLESDLSASEETSRM